MAVERAKRRGFIRFQTKRTPLSREQFLYWMEFLPKILKVATEFEINLPSPKDALKTSENNSCVNSKQPCATDCSHLERCLTDRHPSLCLTRETGNFLGKKFTCPSKGPGDTESCVSCPAWQLNCRKTGCAMFVPVCFTCPTFTRVGDTIEKADIRRNPEDVRREVRELLEPTEDVARVGKFGALEVKKDGSLPNGGIEIPTVGRRVHWNSFYQMCKRVLEPVIARGGFVDERCGQHYHILAGYLKGRGSNSVSELEEPMPEIILANLHQLFRRYELAMFWITSCGDSYEHFTRWARFRQSIFRYSALGKKMTRIQEELARDIVCMNNGQKGKYASVAYHFCEFNEEGNVDTFHIENRIGDGALSPAVVSAWAMLFYAMVLKAVRLSQYGVMEVGDKDYVATVKSIQPHLIDFRGAEFGDDRKGHTHGLDVELRSWLQENTKELVDFLKPELYNLGPAHSILMSLAEKPPAARIIEGKTWAQIEEELMAGVNQPRGDFEDEVREVVDLAGIVDCENLEAWSEEVAAYLGHPPEEVRHTVEQMLQTGRYRWSSPIGALITN